MKTINVLIYTWDFLIKWLVAQMDRVRLPVQITLKKLFVLVQTKL